MQLLIIAIDGMSPELVFSNLDDFPNLKKLCACGSFGAYDAYAYGYGSRDNWVSLYTGLTPQQHGVIGNLFRDTGRKPIVHDYLEQQPFWTMLNEKGISVGMWKGLVTTPPQKINGYMVGGEADFEIDGFRDPLHDVKPVFCAEDRELTRYILGSIDEAPMPKTPADFGLTWEEIFRQPSLVEEILTEDYFSDGLGYLEKELAYYASNIVNMQQHRPVNVLFFYTAVVDFLGHFQSHDPNKRILKEAVKLVDAFVGELLSTLRPDTCIVLSDHGIEALSDEFPNTPEDIQRESFGWRDKSVWLKNGQIVTRARNQAFLSGLHSLKGCFIMAGKNIRHQALKNMRTIDFYPTLLEYFGVKIPEDRNGFVLDIFRNKEIINQDRLLREDRIKRERIWLIQNMEVPEFNRIINEVFLSHRFADIRVYCEDKYASIFRGNQRVKEVKSIQSFNYTDLGFVDQVITGYRNLITKEIRPLYLLDLAPNPERKVSG